MADTAVDTTTTTTEITAKVSLRKLNFFTWVLTMSRKINLANFQVAWTSRQDG